MLACGRFRPDENVESVVNNDAPVSEGNRAMLPQHPSGFPVYDTVYDTVVQYAANSDVRLSREKMVLWILKTCLVSHII